MPGLPAVAKRPRLVHGPPFPSQPERPKGGEWKWNGAEEDNGRCWARLLSQRSRLPTIALKGDAEDVGRAVLPDAAALRSTYSRRHFTIYRVPTPSAPFSC